MTIQGAATKITFRALASNEGNRLSEAIRAAYGETYDVRWVYDPAEVGARIAAGMYSEATAAHPYSQRANLELGAHETGFLLGWIPASVDNDAATDRRPGRQSAALFYAKLNDGHEPDLPS